MFVKQPYSNTEYEIRAYKNGKQVGTEYSDTLNTLTELMKNKISIGITILEMSYQHANDTYLIVAEPTQTLTILPTDLQHIITLIRQGRTGSAILTAENLLQTAPKTCNQKVAQPTTP